MVERKRKEMKKECDLDNYLVEKDLVFMTGEYNRYGRFCARVVKGNHSYLINRTCLQILNDSLNYIGYDLKGAITGAKFILGNRSMCPVMVNPYQVICLFPNKSPQKEDCIWFNPDHIVKTMACGNRTLIELSNGHSILVDSKLYSFNNKRQIANQLKEISSQRGNQPTSMNLHLTRKKAHPFSKDKTGSYNFTAMDEKIA
jgi:competence protein ComK